MAMIFLVCSLLFPLPFSESVAFIINRFSADARNILYSGDAMPSAGTIDFNKANSVTRVGQAVYYFTTPFTFIIGTPGKSLYGHGLTFFLAQESFEIPTNSGGGFLGLFNTTYTDSSRNQIISIEFDSFSNPEWDPPIEHVGINKNSISSVTYTAWNASLHSGKTIDASVSYNAMTQNLDVWWSYGGNEITGLSYKVKMIGFSAASGTNVERHILQSWVFSSSLNMKDKGEDNSKEWKLALGITVVLYSEENKENHNL